MLLICKYIMTKLCYLTPTTTLKSSSNDLLIYFWKLNLLPGAK